MKKTIALIMITIMVLSIPIVATAKQPSNRDLAIERACQVFPEKADSIRCEFSRSMIQIFSSQPEEKIFEETRQYDESIAITYTEFSSGTSFISETRIDDSYFDKNMNQDGSEVISPYLIKYACTISVYPNYSTPNDTEGLFKASGIEFIIDSIGEDNITKTGSCYSTFDAHACVVDSKLWEDSKDAYIKYSSKFPAPQNGTLGPFEKNIEFRVGNDRCYISVK